MQHVFTNCGLQFTSLLRSWHGLQFLGSSSLHCMGSLCTGAATGSLMVQSVSDDTASEAEEWLVHSSATAVAEAMSDRGIQECPLKKRITALQSAGPRSSDLHDVYDMHECTCSVSELISLCESSEKSPCCLPWYMPGSCYWHVVTAHASSVLKRKFACIRTLLGLAAKPNSELLHCI